MFSASVITKPYLTNGSEKKSSFETQAKNLKSASEVDL